MFDGKKFAHSCGGDNGGGQTAASIATNSSTRKTTHEAVRLANDFNDAILGSGDAGAGEPPAGLLLSSLGIRDGVKSKGGGGATKEGAGGGEKEDEEGWLYAKQNRGLNASYEICLFENCIGAFSIHIMRVHVSPSSMVLRE